MRHRALIKFRLAAAYLNLGNMEEGYIALEEGIDLLVEILELSDRVSVKYNTPLLDLIERDKEHLASPVGDMVKQILVEPWDAFRSISDTKRYRSAVEKITVLL